MTAPHEQHLAERIAQVIAHLHDKLGAQAATVEPFFQAYFQRMAPDDLLGRSVENLYGAALSLWKFAEKHSPGSIRLRAYNPRVEQDGWTSMHTVVEIVNDDMPFLVDSVAMALGGLGYDVHLLQHPIVPVRRDAAGQRVATGGTVLTESLMHVEVGAQSDPQRLAEIETVLQGVLQDVRAAVEDWGVMRERLQATVAELASNPPPLDADEVAEAEALLSWMADDNFTFLGYREYDYQAAPGEAPMNIAEGTGLGILRDPRRRVMVGPDGDIGTTPEIFHFLHRQELLIITKANARSTVHRPVHLDYIGLRRFDTEGRVVGERRFIGLFTSAAYNRNPREIPLLRRKVRRVMERAGLAPQSHDGKALLNILETYPRDELFQIGEDDLFTIANAILPLQSRPRIRLLLRRDDFGRFYSCLVYVPRERYDTALRQRFAAILSEALDGRISSFYTQMGDDPLARLHFIISVSPDDRAEADASHIESLLIAAGRSWDDDLHDALVESRGEEIGTRLRLRYSQAFPPGYRDRYDPAVALHDIAKMESLGGPVALAVNLYRPLEAGAGELNFKLYHQEAPVPLSACLPMLEHMGLRVLEEHPFEIVPAGGGTAVWVHDFRLQERSGGEVQLSDVKEKFETCFVQVWQGLIEDDGFNQLVLGAGLDGREVTVLRAYCKYLRQIGIAFSQNYMEDTLAANPKLARLLIDLFHAHFALAPAGPRDTRVAGIEAAIAAALDAVASLDQDRILRRFLNLVQATQRTNFHQRDTGGLPKDRLSFKLLSSQVAGLPRPCPLVEIFVYAPKVEGVHMRGGKVARGGLRWSDRREDFRTEVLGLMKAQMVKNAVIVPVGAKGGFVPKRPPTEGGREALLADGIECYKIFVRGLLDLTDNLQGERVVPPADLVRRDGDDPYLVVAADKGTASFSDIANGVAAEYGYWLGDAFASGGSAGYDHKKMAITARGGFEAVKRHFRELGRDIQQQSLTVVGIGDMSGDVFGNGMLCSRTIRLLAAFDHRHIFVDPDPDPAQSFAERKRLFELPRSSWADYQPALIAPGGGVFDRKAKTIRLTPEIKALFNIERDQVAPSELIRAILTVDADLLWIGGIGTYIKAGDESDAEVGDRANDALRVDGAALRVKVVGEGGNLGCTQRGRIEYALAGGRINTDAVDNSAGVDCSDHEVNIKILLDAVVADGDMTEKQRDRLLADMTDEVAALVLQDNYLQTQTLSLMQAQGIAMLPSIARYMRDLEQRGRLDRAIEFLPDDAALAARQAAGRALCRPELAVLLAYGKTDLYDALLASDLPEDPHFAADLAKYFPRPLRRRFAAAIGRHRLRREIIATSMANSMVNRVGVGFVSDIQEETEASAAAVAQAYAVGREIFALRSLWTDIEALDNQVPAALQSEMLLATIDLLRRTTLWLLRRNPLRVDIQAAVEGFGPGVALLTENLPQVLMPAAAAALEQAAQALGDRGVPEALARRVASLQRLGAALDIVEAANAAGCPIDVAASLYFRLGERLGLDWLRDAAAQAPAGDYWQRLALTAVVDDIDVQQRLLSAGILQNGPLGDPAAAIMAWETRQGPVFGRLRDAVAEFAAAGSVDLARLTLASRHLRALGAG